MSDDVVPVAADNADRDDLVARLKAQVAGLTTSTAEANARADVFEERERTRISGWQEDVKWVMKDFVAEECQNHHANTSLAADCAPLSDWADTYTKKQDCASQGPLAAFSFVASKALKRYRENASASAGTADALSAALKENEELKGSASKLQRDLDESKVLSDERQSALEHVNSLLAQHGVKSQEFNFSLKASREESPSPPEPHAAVGAVPTLEAVKANASKLAVAANPLESRSDLLSDLLGRSSATGRFTSSGTQHNLLGSAGEAPLAALIHA